MTFSFRANSDFLELTRQVLQGALGVAARDSSSNFPNPSSVPIDFSLAGLADTTFRQQAAPQWLWMPTMLTMRSWKTDSWWSDRRNRLALQTAAVKNEPRVKDGKRETHFSPRLILKSLTRIEKWLCRVKQNTTQGLMNSRLALNSSSSGLSLPNVGITGVHHHVWLHHYIRLIINMPCLPIAVYISR